MKCKTEKENEMKFDVLQHKDKSVIDDMPVL